MASTGRSSQGSGVGSRGGSGTARSASPGSTGSTARGSQAGGRGASARDASVGAGASGSADSGGIAIGGSAGMSGGSSGVSGSAGLSGSAGSSRGATSAGGAAGSGPSSRQDSGGQSSARGTDAERQVPIGREGQQSRSAGRSQGASSSASQSNAQGGMQAGAQAYGTPFAFMRRFGEEMDRLFSDFGFVPPGIESELTLLGWPGSGGRSSVSMNANMPRSGGGAVEGRGQVSGAGGSAVSRPRSSGGLTSRSSWMPQVEVLQRGKDLVLRADLPGLRREDVHVEIDDDVLTISGERRYESESEEEGLYHSERSYGRFSRSIPLPPGTDSDACQARFTDGVLEVTVPLAQEQSRARRIEVR